MSEEKAIPPELPGPGGISILCERCRLAVAHKWDGWCFAMARNQRFVGRLPMAVECKYGHRTVVQ